MTVTIELIKQTAKFFEELAKENERHEGDYFEGKAQAYRLVADHLERTAIVKES